MPVITPDRGRGSVAAKDYEKVAREALGMPEGADALPVGEITLGESPAAVHAVTERRVRKIRHALATLPDGARIVRPTIEAADFLTFPEYLAALDELGRIRTQMNRAENTERRKQFDQYVRPDKPSFYAHHETPNAAARAFARIYHPATFTPDISGYCAYVGNIEPHFRETFFLKLPALISESDRQLHTYVTGSSGAGKSEFLKILIHGYAKQAAPPCVFVIDPHGKFADEVAGQKEIIAANRLVYVNPALSKKRTPTLNPFDLPESDHDDAPTVARHIMGVFNLLFQDAGHASLTGNMDALLTPCIVALLRMPNTDILTLQRLLGSAEDSPLFRNVIAHMPDQQRGFIASEWGKKRFEATKDSVIAKIQSLANSPHFINFLCGESTLDIVALVRDRKTVCVSLQKGEVDGDAIRAIGGFTLAMVQAYAYRAHKKRRADMVPIHVFIDECHNFISPTINEVLEEARKFGLHLTLCQQYAGQRMDRELTKTVLGNTGVKIAGFNSEKATHAEMSRVMQIDDVELIGLKKREFYVKTVGRPAFKVTPPDTLVGMKNCVDADTWRAALRDQVGQYYRPIDAAPRTAAAHDTPPAPPAASDSPPPPPVNLR